MSAADPDPHSAAPEFHDFEAPVAPRSRRSAHGQYAEARSVRARDVRDNQDRSWAQLDSRKHFSGRFCRAVGVLCATRRVRSRTRHHARFAHKSRCINNRPVGRSVAISLPTAPAAEEVTQWQPFGNPRIRIPSTRKSTNQKSANHATNKNTISGTSLSSWSRQQKFAMIASFTILGMLLAMSACSKQSAKPALVGVSSPVSAPAAPPAVAALATAPRRSFTRTQEEGAQEASGERRL